MAPIKRRPDMRTIQDTKTYTVKELAAAVNRKVGTIYKWLAEGLSVVDSELPTLIFGHVVRTWLAEKWAAKKQPMAPLGQIRCFGCRKAQPPRPESLEVQCRTNNSISIKGICSVSGHAMFRSVRHGDVEAFLLAAGASPSEVVGFNDSFISPVNPVDELPSTGSLRTQVKLRGKHLPHNPHNERLKKGHFEHAKEAVGRDDKSIAKDVIALFRFEAYFGYRDFGQWSKDDFIAFKVFLREGGLTLPVQKATLKSVKAFLFWLRQQKGYARRIPLQQIDYLSLSMKEMRAASSPERIRPCPTPTEMSVMLNNMPGGTSIQRRNRALIAAFSLTGMRAGAMISLRLKDVDLNLDALIQNAREVDTKFSKHHTSFFVPINPVWLKIFLDYVADRRTLGFDDEDPLFPSIQRSEVGTRDWDLSGQFMTYAQCSKIVKDAFETARFPSFTAHSIRHMWSKIAFGSSLATARAISENLGHANLQITHQNYGKSTLEERKQQLAIGFAPDENKNEVVASALEAYAKNLRGRKN